MTVNDVVQLVKHGELNNLAVSDNVEAVLGYINMGVLELYKRFPLNVEEYLIELSTDTTIYTLPTDLMWIIAAYGEIEDISTGTVGVSELPINDENSLLSVNTIAWNKVQIPLAITGDRISILYAAKPDWIQYDADTEAHLTTEIPLPPQMTEALLHYIGYRAHGAVNGEINSENSTHYNRFEQSCERIQKLGMFTSDTVAMGDRYINSLWV